MQVQVQAALSNICLLHQLDLFLHKMKLCLMLLLSNFHWPTVQGIDSTRLMCEAVFFFFKVKGLRFFYLTLMKSHVHDSK